MDISRTWMPPVELAVPESRAAQPPLPPSPLILPVDQSTPADETEGEETTRMECSTEDDPAATPIPSPDSRGYGLLFGLVIVSLVLLVSLMVQDALLFLTRQWEIHPLLGGFYSLLILALSGIVLTLSGRELRRFRQLRTLSTLRQEASHLIEQETFGHGQRLVNRIALLYREREEMASCLWRFNQQVNDYLGDRELLALCSSHLLSAVDKQAYQVVVRHASAAAVMTAVSPIAWLDALFFIWRNLWMIREVAEVYGARPGAAGSLLLLRQAARGIMGAGLTDLVANSAAQSMGDSLTAMLVSRTGQGVANGLFIARIGLQTMQVCRPLPFRDEEMPSLLRIRAALQEKIVP
ncbi:MAG: TIGR01620 family protein [Magnetococcus sp. XQGC-1]